MKGTILFQTTSLFLPNESIVQQKFTISAFEKGPVFISKIKKLLLCQQNILSGYIAY